MRGGEDEGGGDEGGGDEGRGGNSGYSNTKGTVVFTQCASRLGNSGYSNRHDVQGITVIHKHERISTPGMIHVHAVQQAGVIHDAPHSSQLHMDIPQIGMGQTRYWERGGVGFDGRS